MLIFFKSYHDTHAVEDDDPVEKLVVEINKKAICSSHPTGSPRGGSAVKSSQGNSVSSPSCSQTSSGANSSQSQHQPTKRSLDFDADGIPARKMTFIDALRRDELAAIDKLLKPLEPVEQVDCLNDIKRSLMQKKAVVDALKSQYN